MRMSSMKMKNLLEQRFQNPDWNLSFDRERDVFRIEWKDTKQGIDISLPGVISKWEVKKDAALDELEEHIKEALRVMHEKQVLTGKEKYIFPVIRSASFPAETKDGRKLIYRDHTAETRIYYALDLGKSYRLIDESLLKSEGWTEERVKEVASFNVRSLSTDMKQDEVAGNTFYFIATNDGYDASRILNEVLLEQMKARVAGELAIAVPHHDVCIFADIKNEAGYDILAQMTMQFFAEGRIPITSLSFLYEDQKLEPIFILAKNKKRED